MLLALVFKVVCYTKLHPDLFPQLRGRDEAGLQETVKRANWPRLTSSYLSVLSAKFPVTLSIITLPFIVFFYFMDHSTGSFHTWGEKITWTGSSKHICLVCLNKILQRVFSKFSIAFRQGKAKPKL